MSHKLLSKNIIVIDVESNGLYGQPFCVGAVRLNYGGRKLSAFLGRCPLDQVEDDYVLNNVIPSINNIKENCNDIDSLEKSFIDWYKDQDPVSCITAVDCGFPVDTSFLYSLGCRDDEYGDLWKTIAPYPLHELSSILISCGIDPHISRQEFASPIIGTAYGSQHNPLWDAELSGLCIVRAIEIMNKGVVYG